MRLVNIHSKDRTLSLFCRKEDGTLEIKTVNDFFPYYYEKGDGNFKSYLGESLKKIIVSSPFDIRKQATANSYEADVFFQHRYLLDKVEEITPTIVKHAFLDIEILTDVFPNPYEAEYPISSITVSNSEKRHYKNFYLSNFESEYLMLEAFVKYLKDEQFDMLLGWNMKQFDYPYLFHRIPDFAKKISPIGMDRYGGGDVLYPAGISIVDYMEWDKKVTLNKRVQYSLDAVLESEFGEGKKHKITDFTVLSEELRLHNIDDVKDMVRLEEKNQLIPYFDEIRRLAKVEWEDLMWNSRIIDSLVLQEAKKQNVILPNKPKENEKEDYEGAFRDIFQKGAFFGVGEYDLSSAYPNMIIDFCLDPTNIRDIREENCLEIEGTFFKQNPGALLPTVAKKLLVLKKDIKKELNNYIVDSPEHKKAEVKYSAYKTIANSVYGVMGNRFYRIYDKRVAEATTSLVRNLLHYVKDEVEKKGNKILYVDTDAVFINNRTNLTEDLNMLIVDWGIEKFDKLNLSTKFDFEGVFEKLLLIAKCRYVGYLKKPNGEIKEEICGVEAKRKDSTVFMKKFQKTLINKILNKENKEDIITWVKEQIVVIRQEPLENISFPCRLGKHPDEYKNVPIFLRALRYAQELNESYEKKVGTAFFYVYINSLGNEEKDKAVQMINGKKMTNSTLIPYWEKEYGNKIKCKDMDENLKLELIEKLEREKEITWETIKTKGKAKDVMAFDPENKKHVSIDMVDWEKMINRNIIMKLDAIFNALDWGLDSIL